MLISSHIIVNDDLVLKHHSDAFIMQFLFLYSKLCFYCQL